jgi:hypothetical protein
MVLNKKTYASTIADVGPTLLMENAEKYRCLKYFMHAYIYE